MARQQISPSEKSLDDQPLGRIQLRVVAICSLIQVCDGYDIGSIGWAVPSLTHAWQMPPSAFSLAFLWSNVGMIAGAMLSGPFGDRFGRKPLLLISIALFGIGAFASAAAQSVGLLAVTRFVTGIGIAGAFSGATALTGDYAPQRLRATMIMLTVTGAPFGGFVGGQAAASMLHRGFAWSAIFLFGGLFAAVMVLLTALLLPESPRFLVNETNLSASNRGLLDRLAIASPRRTDARADPVITNSFQMLFGRGYGVQTGIVWVVFFCSLLNLYLFVFWLPEVLHLTGLTPGQAVFATSLQTLGGVVAVLYLGWAIDRFGAPALALHFGAGIAFIALIALGELSYPALLTVVFLSGVTVIGSQTGLNAVCGKLYPARMRATGYGFASGVGRLGGIAAAPLGGFLLSRGLPPGFVFLSACLFAVVAAAGSAFLRLQTRTTRP